MKAVDETSGGPDGLRGAALQQALSVAPFHEWLGLKVIAGQHGALVIEMPWRPEIVSNPRLGSAHGGILASLIDLAGMYAILMQTTGVGATASLHVDYHRPATAGPLRAVSRIVKLGRTISVADTEVLGPDKALLASGRGSYFMKPGGEHRPPEGR